MQEIKRKLNSSKGASVIIALLYFLVAMMVGAVVLTAAATNAGSASHALKDQQEYYAVESAIKLIRSDMAKEKIVISDDGCSFEGEGKILPKAVASTFTIGSSTEISIDASAKDGSTNYETLGVKGKIIFGRSDSGEDDYTVTVTVSVDDDKESYLTKLTFSPIVRHLSEYDGDNNVVIEKTEITWEEPMIERKDVKGSSGNNA